MIKRSVGVVCLLLAAAILAVGYVWSLLVWSGGEYAQPAPSLGSKIGEALPWSLLTVAAAAVPGIVGVFLIEISHPVERVGRRRIPRLLWALVGIIAVLGIVLGAWAAGRAGTDSWWAASTLMYVAVVDAFLIVLVVAGAVTSRARGGMATGET